jgi:4-aminobutyrate aminotransferase-like enzyme
VPCAAALATLDVILREGLIATAIAIGAYLAREVATLPGVEAVQGRGLLLGFRVTRPAAEVQKSLFARRILTGTSGEPNVLRLMPPLTLSQAEAELIVAGLREALA